jgi:YVTN family beta-propeller protein
MSAWPSSTWATTDAQRRRGGRCDVLQTGCMCNSLRQRSAKATSIVLMVINAGCIRIKRIFAKRGSGRRPRKHQRHSPRAFGPFFACWAAAQEWQNRRVLVCDRRGNAPPRSCPRSHRGGLPQSYTRGLVESDCVNFLSIARACCVVLPSLWVSVAGASTANPPVFVLNSLEANVSVIDPVTWTETARIPTGKEPHHLYLTPDEKSVIVANALGDTLTFIDPRTAEVQRTVRDIVDPYHLRFTPDMKWLVTAANRLNHVDFYRWDGKDLTLVKRVATARTPSHLWIDSKSTTVYSTMQDSDELVAIDIATQAIKWRTKTGAMPADLYGSADGKFVFIGLTGSDSVEVFDVSGAVPKSVKLIKTGKGAHAFRAAGDGRHLYVSNRVANTVSKLDMHTQEVIESYPVPGGPDCMEVSADGRYLYVSSRWARKLSVVDTQAKKVVRQVPVGKSPHGVWTLHHAAR